MADSLWPTGFQHGGPTFKNYTNMSPSEFLGALVINVKWDCHIEVEHGRRRSNTLNLDKFDQCTFSKAVHEQKI